MYTKISHGTNFMGAALYDAEGLSNTQKAQKAGKVELLETTNLLSIDAPGIAQEMQKVASYSRSQKPVWNISMSAPDGVRLTAEQWQQAAAENLRVMGVEPERHQYAIYRHSDTPQDHIHILLNSVPVDGGPAVSRQFKAAKAKLAAPQLDQLLGILSPKGESILDEIGRKLATALTHRATDPDELKSDLTQAGVTANYVQNEKGIYGITFQLIDRDHKPVKGSHVLIDGKKAKWTMLAAVLEANRAEYQAEINRLGQEKAQAEKAREIAEKAYNDREHDIDDAFNKRNAMQEVFYRSEKNREETKQERDQAIRERDQAIRERDQARNQPPRTVEKVVEKKVSEPADKARIEQLEKENEQLKRQLTAKEQFGTAIKNILRQHYHTIPTPTQIANLYAGKQVDFTDLSTTFWVEGGNLKTKPIRPKPEPKPVIALNPVVSKPVSPPPPVVEPIAAAKPVVAQAVPTPKPLSPEPPTFDSTIVETMRQIMIKAATKSKTWDGFSERLRLAGVKRQKLATGTFSYTYKNVQATAAELGFKAGEIKALIQQRALGKKQ